MIFFLIIKLLSVIFDNENFYEVKNMPPRLRSVPRPVRDITCVPPRLTAIKEFSPTLAAALDGYSLSGGRCALRFFGCCGIDPDLAVENLGRQVNDLKRRLIAVRTSLEAGGSCGSVPEADINEVLASLKRITGKNVCDLLLNVATRQELRASSLSVSDIRYVELVTCRSVLKIWLKAEKLYENIGTLLLKEPRRMWLDISPALEHLCQRFDLENAPRWRKTFSNFRDDFISVRDALARDRDNGGAEVGKKFALHLCWKVTATQLAATCDWYKRQFHYDYPARGMMELAEIRELYKLVIELRTCLEADGVDVLRWVIPRLILDGQCDETEQNIQRSIKELRLQEAALKQLLQRGKDVVFATKLKCCDNFDDLLSNVTSFFQAEVKAVVDYEKIAGSAPTIAVTAEPNEVALQLQPDGAGSHDGEAQSSQPPAISTVLVEKSEEIFGLIEEQIRRIADVVEFVKADKEHAFTEEQIKALEKCLSDLVVRRDEDNAGRRIRNVLGIGALGIPWYNRIGLGVKIAELLAPFSYTSISQCK